MTFSITIPRLPPAECSPNSRVHWRAKGEAVAIAKDEAIAAVREMGWNSPPIQLALINVSWGVKDKRKRDTDNFVARTKPFIDGIVFTGVVAVRYVAVMIGSCQPGAGGVGSGHVKN